MVVAVREYVAMLWRHRTLIDVLVQREVKARYRGTALGFFWSFVNPLLMMVIYVGVFSLTLRVAVDNYAAFILTGLLPWSSFHAAVMEGMGSLVNNGNLIKKVQLPSEVFPLVAAIANMIHFTLSIPVLVIVLLVSGVSISWHMVYLPVLLLIQLLMSAGLAMLLASLAVQFRDLMHIVPNLMMMVFYLTPIIYGADMVPTKLRPVVLANPLSGLIEGYRAIFLHHRSPSFVWLALCGGFALIFVACALWFFRRRRMLYPELV